MVTLYCPDEAATAALGTHLGSLLTDGDVVLLNGDLGAGKTCLVIAAAKALGVDPAEVTSPTFSLMNIYKGKNLSVKHFDLYRINREEELEDIGFSEYAGYDGVTFIEWAELFPEEMPPGKSGNPAAPEGQRTGSPADSPWGTLRSFGKKG